MPSEIVVARCITEAEKRIDAIEVLCEIIRGQVKGERRELQAIRSALTAPGSYQEQAGSAAVGDAALAMLDG